MHEDVIISPRLAPPMIGVGLLEAIHGPTSSPSPSRRDDGRHLRQAAHPARHRYRRNGARPLGWKAVGGERRDAGRASIHRRHRHIDAVDPQPYRRVHRRADGVPCRAAAAPRSGSVARRAARPRRSRLLLQPAILRCPRGAAWTIQRCSPARRCSTKRGASCHTPKYVTSRDAPQPEYRFQLIWPYTDLLLHDMGEASRRQHGGDARPERMADGAVLGIGLPTVNGAAGLCTTAGRVRCSRPFSGTPVRRARRVERVVKMTPEDRADLLRFIDSL